VTDDIVARLREGAPDDCGCHCVRCEAADEIKRLRAERDEARREVCAYASGRYRKDVVTLDRAATLDEANRRGWDCFKEVTDGRG
jgi:putative hemolysin